MTLFKGMLVNWLCSPLVGKILGFLFSNRIPSHGLIIDSRSVTDWIRATLFWGMYESAEARLVKKDLRLDLPVVELGSSLGVISCLIRQRLNPEVMLYCVEPNPAMIPCIQSNLTINDLNNNVSIFQYAIGYDQPEVSLVLGNSNITPKTSLDCVGDLKVPTVTLSQLLKIMSISGNYALVVDIEGAEADIIYSDTPALKQCVQIIIEFHPTTYKQHFLVPDQMIEKLLTYSYRLQKRIGAVCVFERI